MIDMDRVVMLYEIRGLYDGWSAAEYEDGTFHNRWPKGDRRYEPTEEFIRELEAYNERQAKNG